MTILRFPSRLVVPASRLVVPTRYLDQPLDAARSHKLHLVRGVYLNRGTGSFDAYFDGRDLTVHHGSLGRRAVPMKRQPLVIALPTQPQNVYVTASMAE